MRILRVLLWTLAGLAVLGGALFAWFVYTPTPERPHLSGTLAKGSIQAGGMMRLYRIYIPKDLPGGAPLVAVLHGSGGNGAQMRVATGYGFERLADKYHFAVVYPDGFEGYWNACNIVGDYAANTRNIDDVGFLTALAGKLTAQFHLDPRRVFATGLSRGGHMAYRLALEAPSHFRAVAAVGANVPAPENFKCKPKGQGTSSVLIMNGTRDPLNPFNGGEVKLFGFIRRGTVLSSRASAQYFADRNAIAAAPQTRKAEEADGVTLEQVLWRGGRIEIELDAIHGGGHVVPQPWSRAPRILGPTPKAPDGTALIWNFFARQR